MAGTFNDFLELEILDHVWGAAVYTAPTDHYFGLWTAALDDTSTGSTANEVSGNNYSRQSLVNNATNFPAAAAGAKSNGVAVTGWSAVGGTWGTVTHVGNCAAATVGDMLAWMDLTASKTINDGDTAEIAIGDFDITLT